MHIGNTTHIYKHVRMHVVVGVRYNSVYIKPVYFRKIDIGR